MISGVALGFHQRKRNGTSPGVRLGKYVFFQSQGAAWKQSPQGQHERSSVLLMANQNYGKSAFLMGKSTIKRQFSIAFCMFTPG